MLGCEHHVTMIQSSRGSGGEEFSGVCVRCGEIQVNGRPTGGYFSTHFSLVNSYLLLAASQAYRLSSERDAGDVTGKTVSKPVDFGGLRLYQVHLHWCLKSGKQGRETYVVAADSPNQSYHSAANQIRELYKESYDNNPEMSYWDVKGYALNVLQPLSWTTNGISLLSDQLSDPFVPGEWICPQCSYWGNMQYLDENNQPMGVAHHVAEIPKCPADGTEMRPATWREAARQAGSIAQRHMNRAKALEEAWPVDRPMPVFDDEAT